jgi:sterol desaturase/sphingolipid hydroxylase (fatty acid hydroxylase superfamily)
MHWDKIWWWVFVVAFAVTALGETFLPLGSLPTSTARRWMNNSLLLAVSVLVARCAFLLTGIALAFTMRGASHGVLNTTALPYSVRFLVGFAALDLTAYFSHRLFHAVAPLWRVHQVHHSETDLDLTTGFRFHPVEALFTQGLALATVAALGVSPGAVALGGLAVVVQDFFTHANFRIPEAADRILRLLIITPPMHRIHHSELVPEQNKNFGTVFSLWDRLFGTYAVPSNSGQVCCGLVELAGGSGMHLGQLLWLPFRRVPKLTAPVRNPVEDPGRIAQLREVNGTETLNSK